MYLILSTACTSVSFFPNVKTHSYFVPCLNSTQTAVQAKRTSMNAKVRLVHCLVHYLGHLLQNILFSIGLSWEVSLLCLWAAQLYYMCYDNMCQSNNASHDKSAFMAASFIKMESAEESSPEYFVHFKKTFLSLF